MGLRKGLKSGWGAAGGFFARFGLRWNYMVSLPSLTVSLRVISRVKSVPLALSCAFYISYDSSFTSLWCSS